MPIRNQIEAVVSSMKVVPPKVSGEAPTAPGFLYGTTKELNALADDAAFPCVFMYAIQPITSTVGMNGSVNNKIDLMLAFLFETEFDQFSADDEVNVNTAVRWANVFMLKAAHYREDGKRYFRIKPGQTARCVPFYNRAENDVCVSGCTLAFTVQLMYDDLIIE